jgi:HlyD family secretion protein
MYQRLRNLVIIGCIVTLLAAFVRVRVLSQRGSADNAAVQEISVIDRGDIVLTVSATGPVHAKQEVALAFPSTGNVAQINVAEGDRVLKGQTLASLDVRNLQAALQNAQLAFNLQQVAYKSIVAAPRDVDVKAAKATLDAAKAQLGAASVGYDPLQVKIAQLQLELAKNMAWQSQIQRDQAVAQANAGPPEIISQLYAEIWRLPPDLREKALELLALLSSSSALGGSFLPSPKDAESQVRRTDYDIKIAQAQLDQTKGRQGDVGSVANAQLAVTSAQAALDALLEGADAQTLAIVDAQMKAAQAALDLATYNLSRSTLVAPFSGVLAKINLTTGEPAPLDKPAVVLIDDASFYVDIPVDEIDIAKVAEGQPVTLAFDSLPGEVVTGRVSRIAQTALGVGDVVTYPVRIDVDAAGHTLRAGMSTTATITVNELNDVLRVRNRFVRLDRKTGRATVVVRNANGSLREVQVTLGLRNETYSEVKAGLSAGDTVVVLPREFNLLR